MALSDLTTNSVMLMDDRLRASRPSGQWNDDVVEQSAPAVPVTLHFRSGKKKRVLL
jgi:hypothetical protein